ncbi:MAG: MogA/MoaB family molybdenum cofactor biosynthesis protein [Acidobacteria bacterium]|nr:MogA/MoaB family molybdenum cofactor biosynthesis protein [Acidobacteriota bacterium]
MSHIEHKEKAKRIVSCAVITVSDSRTEETDVGGKILKEQLSNVGHKIIYYQVIKDDPEQIKELLLKLSDDVNCQAMIFNGGTGISRRDRTFDVIDSFLEKRLVGFGEIFRYLSYLDIGSSAIMSRATAGSYKGRVVISIPGSPAAVRLAVEKLILPEIAHMVWELGR